MLRDNDWLWQLLDEIWSNHFSDVPQPNTVRIEFGRRARTRLGSIKRDRGDQDITVITMNGLFKRDDVPEYVVRGTIAHELVHYAHGFHSPLPQKYKHPHAGGVVEKEYADRGLHQQYLQQKAWLKAEWPKLIGTELAPPKRRRPARRKLKVVSPFWF